MFLSDAAHWKVACADRLMELDAYNGALVGQPLDYCDAEDYAWDMAADDPYRSMDPRGAAELKVKAWEWISEAHYQAALIGAPVPEAALA